LQRSRRPARGIPKSPPAASEFAALAAPARRALSNAKITSLAQLAKKTEAEVAALHGTGPNALGKLKRAMKTKGLSFRKG
jgi:hypothetical protein